VVVGCGLCWLFYSCCSHLEHRASVKRFVSLHFLNLRHAVGLLGREIRPSQGCYLTQTQNKHKETSMPRVGFEPTFPAFERVKTIHDLERAAKIKSGKCINIFWSCEMVVLDLRLLFGAIPSIIFHARGYNNIEHIVCMYVFMYNGWATKIQPLHRDLQWSIVLPF
jgi:hypothetical protein